MLKAYSFKLKQDVWLLYDEEYAPIQAALQNLGESIKKYRSEFSVSLDIAEKKCDAASESLGLYQNLTGQALDSVWDLYHIKLSNYGRLCPQCKKPFRTPRAKFCAECSYRIPQNKAAGRLKER